MAPGGGTIRRWAETATRPQTRPIQAADVTADGDAKSKCLKQKGRSGFAVPKKKKRTSQRCRAWSSCEPALAERRRRRREAGSETAAAAVPAHAHRVQSGGGGPGCRTTLSDRGFRTGGAIPRCAVENASKGTINGSAGECGLGRPPPGAPKRSPRGSPSRKRGGTERHGQAHMQSGGEDPGSHGGGILFGSKDPGAPSTPKIVLCICVKPSPFNSWTPVIPHGSID